MAFPLINPTPQFFDSSGNPLDGGTIDFRDPATDLFIDSYPTADDANAQSNPNDNPLTLSSLGAAPQGLYLEDAVKYKVTLYDSDNNPVWVQDDVQCPQEFTQASVGATLWPVLGTETGVTNTSYEYYNVLRFGADSTGVTDSASAIRNCLTSANAARLTGNSGIYGVLDLTSDSGPTCFFPQGIYDIGSALTTAWSSPGVDGINYLGEEAILVDTSKAVDLFDYLDTRTSFKGFIFRGFNNVLKYRTQNITTTHHIEDCEFISQNGIAISSDNNSASTQLTIDRVRYESADTGAVFLDTQMDRVEVNNAWLQSSNDITYQVRNRIRISNSTHIPKPGTDGQTWIELASGGTAVYELNNHWGGENSGRTIIRNRADADDAGDILPVVISMKNSEGYTNDAMVELYGLPNNLTIDPIYDDSPAQQDDQIWVDSGITAAELKSWARFGVVNIDPRNGRARVTNNEGVATMLAIKNRKYRSKEASTQIIDTADVLSSGDSSGGNWLVAGTAGKTASTNPFGATTIVFTASGDDQSFQHYNQTFLVPADLSDKTYTLAMEIRFTPASDLGQLEILADVGHERTHLDLKPGRHMYSMPFRYLNSAGPADTDLDRVQYQSGTRMKNGDVVEFGRWLLLDDVHEYSSINLQAYGSAAPLAIALTTGPDQGYFPGDIVWDTTPLAAAKMFVCTVEGDPGTWITE